MTTLPNGYIPWLPDNKPDVDVAILLIFAGDERTGEQGIELTLAYMDGGGVLHYALPVPDDDDELPGHYIPIAWQYPPVYVRR